MKRSEFYFILKAFLGWLAILFVILFFAVKFLDFQPNFLGGGLQNYLNNPYFWSWGNFDGEHYVSIAMKGFGFGERAFFPLYPILIGLVGKIFGSTIHSFNLAGILVSLISFFVGLIGFYKLIRLDYSEKTARIASIFLLIFPTSFYFAGVYTESLFFSLIVWAFYFARKGNWVVASILGILLTATRFVGLIIFPAFIIEWFVLNWEKNNYLKTFPLPILAIPSGLLTYIAYLQTKFGNALAFYTDLSIFGQQRSDHLITLPQVFYRYVVKILPSLNTSFFPIIFTTWLEFFVGVLFLFLIIYSFNKIRLSYWALFVLGYLIPTFSGSFSSLPRYVLVLFPVYIFAAILYQRKKGLLLVFGTVSFILLVTSFVLFSRGYWIS